MTNKYARDISHLKTMDPYRLQELYRMHPCAEHVVKKMLCAGERSGGKSLDEDIQDCIDTLTRWQEMRKEDSGGKDESLLAQPTIGAYRWETIPNNYRFAAIDLDGSVYVYAEKPFITNKNSVGWLGNGTKIGTRGGVKDWRGTLEERPQ